MARGPVLIRRQRTRPAEGGFTLIELLVTLLVTVIALAGLFGVFSVTARGNSAARESSEALSACEATADDIKSLTIAQIEAHPAYGPVSAWDNVNGVDFHEGSYTGTTGVRYSRKVFARRVDDDLVWMKIAVLWKSEGATTTGIDDGAHDHQIAVEMLRSRTEGAP